MVVIVPQLAAEIPREKGRASWAISSYHFSETGAADCDLESGDIWGKHGDQLYAST